MQVDHVRPLDGVFRCNPVTTVSPATNCTIHPRPGSHHGAGYSSETFRVLKNNEERNFGEYSTQRLVLAVWDSLELQIKEQLC